MRKSRDGSFAAFVAGFKSCSSFRHEREAPFNSRTTASDSRARQTHTVAHSRTVQMFPGPFSDGTTAACRGSHAQKTFFCSDIGQDGAEAPAIQGVVPCPQLPIIRWSLHYKIPITGRHISARRPEGRETPAGVCPARGRQV